MKHTWRELGLERGQGPVLRAYMPGERGSRDSEDEETRNDFCAGPLF